MSVCFSSLSVSLSDVTLSQYLLSLFLCVLFHVVDEFFVGVADCFACGKLIRGIFRWSAVPNLATSDLLSTVSCCPGTFMVRVVSVVFTRAAPSGMASYMPCSCFLFLWAASVRRASWRRGLCLASGCWMLVDGSVKIRGISLLSLLASSSFCLLASCTSALLSRSSSYHLSSDISLCI